MSQSATHFTTLPTIALYYVVALFMISYIVPRGNCHISSVLNGADYTGDQRSSCRFFNTHRQDGKAPLSLSHIRLSRGPSVPTVPHTDDEETATSRMHFLKPPTYQHKYLQRLSQFHGNDRSFSPIMDVGGYTNGIWNENNPVSEPEVDAEQDEAFSPFIGARALSNIPKFFEHLRANIEALKANEDVKNDNSVRNDESTDRRTSMEEPWFTTSDENNPWNPVISNRYRTFHHQPLDRPRHSYNPSWQYTNLGLGRRR